MITAIDLSLTATGVADSDGRRAVLVPPKGRDRGMRRIQWVLDQVHIFTEKADLVVIEGYSFGSQGSAVFNIAELGGVVRFTLWEADKPMVEVPPSCLKLFATGHGNAKKDEVLAAAIRRLGYDGHDHNVADALWLLEMAKARGATNLSEPKARALEKLQWPTALPPVLRTP